MDRGDGTTEDRGDQSPEASSPERLRSSGDPVLDTIFDRFPPWVVAPLLILGIAVMGSVKWMSSSNREVPGWLGVLWVVVAVPTFALMLGRAYRWLRRPRSSSDPTTDVAEQPSCGPD